MLQRTPLHEIPLRDILELRDHAVRVAQMDLRVRVEFLRAQQDHIAQAFAGAMHAGHSVGFGVDLADEAEREVDFGVGFLHGGHDQFLQAVFRVGTFRHDVGFQGNLAGSTCVFLSGGEDRMVVGLPLERLVWWVIWGLGSHIAHAVVEAEEEAFHEDAGC